MYVQLTVYPRLVLNHSLTAWNTSMILWIFWTGTGGLVFFINGIMWHDDSVNRAPVWCDIGEYPVMLPKFCVYLQNHSASRFIHVQSLGILISTALLNHRVYKMLKLSIACISNVNVSFLAKCNTICSPDLLIERENDGLRSWLRSRPTRNSYRHM